MGYAKDVRRSTVLKDPELKAMIQKLIMGEIIDPIEIQEDSPLKAKRLREKLYGIFRLHKLKDKYRIRQEGGSLVVEPKPECKPCKVKYKTKENA